MNSNSRQKSRNGKRSNGNNFRKNSNNRNNNRNGGRGGNQRKSQLDPALFIQQATYTEVEEYVPTRKIADLPVNRELVNRLLKKGFEFPTEIQDRTLEPLMKGRDLVGLAQTGTGKTAAFLVPIIHTLLETRKKSEHALIVVPTRELAIQVNDEFRSMTKGLKLYSEVFIGGTNINRDIQALRRSSHLIVGTPGRLLDLAVNHRALNLGKFNVLVLDEFDRMLDMGFARDMDRIIEMMKNREHTMLFSATLDKSQEEKVRRLLTDPVQVRITTGDSTADRVDQDIIRMDHGADKFSKLCEILRDDDCGKVLVFDETKHRVNRLAKKLSQAGFRCDQIQGNKSQNARQKALKAFRKGDIDILVATDVAGRGIDVDDVTHVINYQPPITYDSYIHRIGRTGRAGRTGKALTFID